VRGRERREGPHSPSTTGAYSQDLGTPDSSLVKPDKRSPSFFFCSLLLRMFLIPTKLPPEARGPAGYRSITTPFRTRVTGSRPRPDEAPYDNAAHCLARTAEVPSVFLIP